MSKNAMAGAITLCGVGLCTIGGGLMMQSGSAAHAGSMPLAAIAAATHTQAGPTIVWYGNQSLACSSCSGWGMTLLFRAWSDGRVEYLTRYMDNYGNTCGLLPPSCPNSGGWRLLTDPAQGYSAAADIDADELVDGADLASVLNSWGVAPRVSIPPSDCPLNLINP